MCPMFASGVASTGDFIPMLVFVGPLLLVAVSLIAGIFFSVYCLLRKFLIRWRQRHLAVPDVK